MRLLFVCSFLFFNVIYTIQYYSQVNSVRIEKIKMVLSYIKIMSHII